MSGYFYLKTVLVGCVIILNACQKKSPAESEYIPPVYVTVAGHIEDTAIYASPAAYPDYRQRLLNFAETYSQSGAAFNLQIDYEFFIGTVRHETDAMRALTNGLNIIDYLVTRYGYEIDAHQEGGWEEGQDNYADVRFIGGTLTEQISDVVGGLVWDDANQFARLSQGEAGWLYPDFTWYPQIITLAVSYEHHLGDFSRDDIGSGIWMPKGANDEFWIHDPNAEMVYVGPGEHSDWGNRNPQYLSTPEFVQDLVDKLSDGSIPRDRMYTVTMAVPQSIIFDVAQHAVLLNLLDQIAPLVEEGKAQFVTYSEAVEIWRNEFNSEPNVYFRGE